jgi:uncharacterized membrane protein
MSQAQPQSYSFDLLGQATAVAVVFQAALLIARIFNNGESSGGMAVILGATLLQFGLTRRIANVRQRPHTPFQVFLWRYGTLLLLGAITLVSAYNTYAPGTVIDGTATLIAMLLSALLALKGAVLGKLPPDSMLGLRLRWTRQSRVAWDQAHRLMGQILFFGGAACLLVAPFMPLASLAGLAALGVASITAGVFKSWRAWRADPARKLT